MILYLFLVVVGDRQGRSFYSDRLITEILRLSGAKLDQGREELIREGLISYRRPYWEVKNLPQRRDHGRDDQANHPLSSGRPKAELLPDSRPDRDLRKRASRIYRGSCPDKREKRDFILDEYRSLIAEWFKEYPTLKAQQVHEWVRTRGVKISYPAVVKYTRQFRNKVPKAYHHSLFYPGKKRRRIGVLSVTPNWENSTASSFS